MADRPTVEDIREEARRVRRVQAIVQVATSLLAQGRPSRSEGEALVALARRHILELFPGREDTYDILYGRRFRRLLDEYTRPDDPPGGLTRVRSFGRDSWPPA